MNDGKEMMDKELLHAVGHLISERCNVHGCTIGGVESGGTYVDPEGAIQTRRYLIVMTATVGVPNNQCLRVMMAEGDQAQEVVGTVLEALDAATDKLRAGEMI